MEKISTLLFVALMSTSLFATGDALSGKFTINEQGDQIVFSKGNLQAKTTDLGISWNWTFAVNQWDYIGKIGANNAITGNGVVSTNGTVDLFGWSTAATYYGIHNSTSYSTYYGDFVDWGTLMGDGWRTLTSDEWLYIFNTRPNGTTLRGQAMVNGVCGYILLPDEWIIPDGLSFNATTTQWTTNYYEGDDWTTMENAGAVFLPAAYARNISSSVDIYGYYWSSSLYYECCAYRMFFWQSSAEIYTSQRRCAYSVRLVQTAVADESTAINNTSVNANFIKLFHNGQILILRGEKAYTMTGQEVR